MFSRGIEVSQSLEELVVASECVGVGFCDHTGELLLVRQLEAARGLKKPC